MKICFSSIKRDARGLKLAIQSSAVSVVLWTTQCGQKSPPRNTSTVLHGTDATSELTRTTKTSKRRGTVNTIRTFWLGLIVGLEQYRPEPDDS